MSFWNTKFSKERENFTGTWEYEVKFHKNSWKTVKISSKLNSEFGVGSFRFGDYVWILCHKIMKNCYIFLSRRYKMITRRMKEFRNWAVKNDFHEPTKSNSKNLNFAIPAFSIQTA